MKRKMHLIVAMVALAGLAACNGPAPSSETGFNFFLNGVPGSTDCKLVGSRGKSWQEKTVINRGVVLKARGYADEGTIRCTMADGAVYESNWNQLALGPQGARMLAGETWFSKGHAEQGVKVTYGNFYRMFSFKRVQ